VQAADVSSESLYRHSHLSPGFSPFKFSCLSRVEPQRDCDASVAYGFMMTLVISRRTRSSCVVCSCRQARPWWGARGAAAPGPQIPGAPSSICTCVEYVLRQKRNVGRLGKVKRQRFIGRGVGDSSISKSSYQFLINLLFPFRRREKATRRWQPERLTARRQVEPSVLSACASVLSP
jgi:hypothetical protein